jgi:hypothetical protein
MYRCSMYPSSSVLRPKDHYCAVKRPKTVLTVINHPASLRITRKVCENADADAKFETCRQFHPPSPITCVIPNLSFLRLRRVGIGQHRHSLVAYRSVVECDTNCSTVVSVVLPNNALTAKLPQSRIVIGAACNQVCTVGREGAVPHPTLVAMQCGLKRERSWITILRLG